MQTGMGKAATPHLALAIILLVVVVVAEEMVRLVEAGGAVEQAEEGQVQRLTHPAAALEVFLGL